jgi:DegV family protein with EDD domain
MVKITADSTCDLSQELIEKYHVSIIPIHIILDGKDYQDGVDITPKLIFDACGGKNTVLCKSSATNPADYFQFFQQHLSPGDEIIHIGLSSEISSCFRNAQEAAKELPGVYPVDSRNLSTGSGHLVCLAAELAQQGLSGAEIAAQLQEIAQRVNVSFVIDTLDYLRKGGRCSTLAALGANLLSLKPCIEVKDGVMVVGKKYRGKIGKCLQEYVKDRLEHIEQIDPKRIFVTSTMQNPEDAKAVEELVRSYGYFQEILVTTAGSVVSCHCGPNTLGILYIMKEN